MSVAAEDFLVFETYRDAGGHAFAKGVVSEDDKDSYNAVFQHLRDAVSGAIARSPASDELDDWNCRFSRDGGIQGQRPIDLWASIINRDSDDFSRFPQIYVIASEGGVELGFSVTIHEDDYFNAELKRRNRSIIPIVNGNSRHLTATSLRVFSRCSPRSRDGVSEKRHGRGRFRHLTVSPS
jgi:hypothetical protein